MTAPVFSPDQYLAQLLRARLNVFNVSISTFSPRHLMIDEVITTHRLILVQSGQLRYEVDGETMEITPGQQIFVPAWTRRRWRGHSRQSISFAWFEFSAGETDDSLHTLFWRPRPTLSLETESLKRMTRLWPKIPVGTESASGALKLSNWDRLLLEGEAKAILSRFWREARPLNPDGIVSFQPSAGIHPDLKIALAWLHENYLHADALTALYQEIHLSPNHFRLLFRRSIGCSPQEHLTRLRLRRARHLVQETDLPLKQIAGLVGFADPLFFSRQYHRFWGASPRQDRSGQHQ